MIKKLEPSGQDFLLTLDPAMLAHLGLEGEEGEEVEVVLKGNAYFISKPGSTQACSTDASA